MISKTGITDFLAENALKNRRYRPGNTGKNGDLKNDAVIQALDASIFKNTAMANYKHLCGEYPTSSSFALWLAANIIKKAIVPEIVSESKSK